MPSPFPGMDPFLESHNFDGLHDSMAYLVQESIQGRLPEGYFAVMGERVWIDTSQRWIEPDNIVTQTSKKPKKTESGGVVTLTNPVIVTVPHDEHTESYLDIYLKRGEKQRLVCTIEILSLSNKTPGKKSQKLYRRKQREVLARKVHLVEIDLLRAGKHTTAVALDWAKAKTGDFDYHVCVRRYNRFEEFEVYPILMQQPLPTIAIPLLPSDGDVSLDLQAIFQRAYEAGPYARSLDCRTEPLDPPLSSEQMTWMRDMLRRAGIRRKSG